MAELIKDQMLQDELAKVKMGEDEVAWYQFDVIVAKFLTKFTTHHISYLSRTCTVTEIRESYG